MRLNSLRSRASSVSALAKHFNTTGTKSVETRLLRRNPAPSKALDPDRRSASLSKSFKSSIAFAVKQEDMAKSETQQVDKDLYAKEQKLLLAAKSIDQALVERDASLLDKVFAKDIVLHSDRLTVQEDLKGAHVKQYYEEYWANYEYKHSPVVTAANGKVNTAFTFAVDEDVRAKSESSGKPSLSVSVWAYEFDNDTKVSEIWFLRSLTDGEVSDLLKKPIGNLGLKAQDYFKLREPQLAPDQGRTDTLYKAAEKYSDMWATGKPADIGTFVEGGFHEIDPLLGKETKGAEGLQHDIKGLSLMWQSTSQEHQIAVTPDSLKAFVLWKQDGFFKETNKKDSLYGLNVIVFDKAHKIEKVLGFRQIMKSEQKKMVK